MEDVIDPNIEATLAGETSDNQAGQIVGRIFGDTAPADAPEQPAGNAVAATEAKRNAAPAESETASVTSAPSTMEEACGRVVTLPPLATCSEAPVLSAVTPAADSRPDDGKPLQAPDAVSHRDFEPDDRF